MIELRKEGNQSRITATTARGSGAGAEMLSRSSAAVVMSSKSSGKQSDSADDDLGGRLVGVDESEGSADRSGGGDKSGESKAK